LNSNDEILYNILADELAGINDGITHLLGINNINSRNAFIRQIIDSMRRIEYIDRIKERDISADRCDPTNAHFDPIRAAILKKREGNIDEAIWLIFLSTHFGKHLRYGWLRTRDLYSGLEENNIWSWDRICKNQSDFADWFNINYASIRGAFGNHRKYESIRPDTRRNLIAVISSYIGWVGENNSHTDIVNNATEKCESDPKLMFLYLYNSLSNVVSFGRTARFDYLTMLGKTSMFDIVPGSPYLKGSTGPLKGACLLLTGNRESNIEIATLEEMLHAINNNLSIGAMGMQVLEDSLCNWQKTPSAYMRFRG